MNSLRVVATSIVSFVILALIACGGGGGGTSNNNVPPPLGPLSVSITPMSATVVVSSSQQFKATVSNSSNTGVDWQVNGVSGGSSATGMIDSKGLYMAPANVSSSSIPSAATVTVTAVSKADSTKSSSATVTVSLPQSGHVFLLMEENHSFSQVIGTGSPMPYLNSLASKYGLATNYFADTHPSIGNYFMLTTGQLITNDDSYTTTVDVDNLVRELLAAGKTWKSYAENLPSVGYTGPDAPPYLAHHNPFSFFSDVRNSSNQLQNLVPYTQFAPDLANNHLPNFSFIVPNAVHDAHDCPGSIPNCTDAQRLAAADSWLQTNVAPLLASPLFQKAGDGVLVIAFDEGFCTSAAQCDNQNGGGHVAMLVIGPKAKQTFASSAFYKHESTLRMLIELTGAKAYPGSSAAAPDTGEFF